MTERLRVHDAAARVRSLLEKLASPHPALQHIVQGADAHVASLSPQLSILDVTPFGALPEAMPEVHGRSDDVVPRTRRRMDTPEQRAARRSALRPGPVADTTRPAAEPAAAPKRVSAPVFPIGTGQQRPARDIIAAREELVTRPATPLPPAAGNPSREAVPMPEGGRTITRRVDAPVDLGALVERVLRHTRGDAQARRVDHTAAGAASRRVQAEMARTAVRRTPAETHTLPPPTATRLTAEHELAVHRAPIIATHVEPGAPAAAQQASAQPTRTAPVFYFNPLEPRASGDDSDDALAERIGQVLRDQARRQGVDVT